MSAIERAREFARRRIVLLLLILGLPVFLANYFGGRPGINGWDANYYYAYAGAFSTGRLDLDYSYREIVARGGDAARFGNAEGAASGAGYNYFPIGHPLLHTPAAFLGRGIAKLISGNSSPFEPVSQLFYCLSCILAAGAGLELIRREVSRTHDEGAAAAAVLAMAACSMLGYYWFLAPALSHTSSLFAAGLIMVAFNRIEKRRELSVLSYLALGLVCGYAMAIRLQDVGLAGFCAVAAWLAIRNPLPAGTRFARVAALLAGGLLGFLPQLLHWKVSHGAWLVTRYGDNGSFDFASPVLGSVLFSARHGLFVWHPALLVAFAGFALWGAIRAKVDHRRPLAGACFLAFAGVAWIGASYSIWWFGDSFGSRPFLSVTPLFVLGLAEVYARLRDSGAMGRAAWWLAVGVFAAWNSLLAIAFHFAWISRSGPLDPGVVFRHF